MARGQRKHLYFAVQYQHVLEHIEKKSNESQYIIDLVIKDMEREKKGIDPDILEHVNQLVNARLANVKVVSEEKESQTKEGIEVSANDIEDLF